MNVLITGASRGIGEELALKFASSKQVKNIYLLSRNISKLQVLHKSILNKNKDTEVFPIQFDFLNPDFKTLNDQISCNHVHILINNAGYLVNKPFNHITKEEIQKMFTVNFTGPVQLIQTLINKLGTDDKSHIVNIGSMGGYQGSAKFPGLSIYSASKAALACLSECLAVEFSNKNISANCLALGAAQTEMLEEAFPGYSAPVSAKEMAEFIVEFAIHGGKLFNGKIIPVAITDPS